MAYFKDSDLAMLIKKFDIMAIDSYYNQEASLISRLYCLNNDCVYVDSKPSKIINTICEIYNNADYITCSKKTKKTIVCDKKVPVLVNDELASIWLPLSSTNNDTDTSCWINMSYVSLNPHTALINKKSKAISLIFNDGQKMEIMMNPRNFLLKWGEGAALIYEVEKQKRRIASRINIDY